MDGLTLTVLAGVVIVLPLSVQGDALRKLYLVSSNLAIKQFLAVLSKLA